MQKTNETGVWRTDDGRLLVRTTATCPATGKIRQKQKKLPPGSTMQDAINLRDSLKSKIEEAAPKDGSLPIVYLVDYAEQWIEDRAATVKPSTLSKYEEATQRICERIGGLPIGEVYRRDVDAWARWLERTKYEHEGEMRLYSTSTLRAWWRVLVTMLRDAVADGYIEKDPTCRVKSPKTSAPKRREQSTLSADEVGELVMATKQFMPQWYAEVATLAFTGMRAGELYALEWDDIDWRGERIQIRRSVWKGEVGSTKTGAAREAPLPTIVAEALQDHRTKMIRDGHPGLQLGLVFPTVDGGYRSPSSVRQALKKIVELTSIEQRVGPQVLRRTFNTLLANAQVDRVVLRSIIGHTSEEMTQRYAGVRLDKKQEAVARLVDMATASSSGPENP